MSNYFSSSNTLSSSSISTFVNTYYGKKAKENNDIYDAFKTKIDDMKTASTTLTEKITAVKTHVMTNIEAEKIKEAGEREREKPLIPAAAGAETETGVKGGRKSKKSKKYKKSKKSKKSRKSKKSKTRR